MTDIKKLPANKESALSRFNRLYAKEDNENPLERLRFFCSLAMDVQDWIDVEPFFDALPAIPEGMNWQPIETAPKDETEILIYTTYGSFYVVSYDDMFSAPWRIRNDEGLSKNTPTHWMPLPEAPKP